MSNVAPANEGSKKLQPADVEPITEPPKLALPTDTRLETIERGLQSPFESVKRVARMLAE